MTNTIRASYKEGVFSQNNLSLCKANYFEACWCRLNSTEPVTCPYLVRYVGSYSNSSYFCVYHTIRKVVECFNKTAVYPKEESVSNIYLIVTLLIFTVGFVGNGLTIIILLNTTLRRLGIYRNLTLLCMSNIFYLLAVFVRHINNYNQDLRNISPNLCRIHTFAVAFTGHLCSWQLISTSVQRVYVLFSLRSHPTTSWRTTLGIFFVLIVLPLLIFDGQILFNYGLLSVYHMCDQQSLHETKQQFQRALNYPINDSLISNVPVRFHKTYFQLQSAKPMKCTTCIVWNIFDTLIYAIIPFVLILASSLIIIIKICQRRRSIISLGGQFHSNRQVSVHDNLSILLIVINCLFLIMIGPFNICLIIRSTENYLYSKSSSTKIFAKLDEYLRSIQNSYHALSFVFYCVIGKKFRKAACSLCRSTSRRLLIRKNGQQRTQTSIILHFLNTKDAAKRRLTTSSSPTNGKRASTTSNTNVGIRKSYITDTPITKKATFLDTLV